MLPGFWAAPVHLPALGEFLQAVVELGGDHHSALELGVHLEGIWNSGTETLDDRDNRCLSCSTCSKEGCGWVLSLDPQ